jgi:hypothetical protein
VNGMIGGECIIGRMLYGALERRILNMPLGISQDPMITHVIA